MHGRNHGSKRREVATRSRKRRCMRYIERFPGLSSLKRELNEASMRFSDPLPLFRPTPGRNTPFNGRYEITLTTVLYRSPGQKKHTFFFTDDIAALCETRICTDQLVYDIRFNYFGISRGFDAMLGIRGLTTCSLNSVFGSWRVSRLTINNSFSILEYLFKIREEINHIALLEIPFFRYLKCLNVIILL